MHKMSWLLVVTGRTKDGVLGSLSVDVPSMTDLHHRDDSARIVYFEEDPETPLAETISVLSGEFLAPRWTGYITKTLNPLNDAAAVLRLKSL